MKATWTLAVLLLLAAQASATEIGWNNIFTECSDDMGQLECFTISIIPNLHLKAAKLLIVDSIFSIKDLLLNWFLDFDWEPILDISLSFSYLWTLLSIPFSFLGVFLLYFLGVVAAIFAYVAILMVHFILSYLLLSIGWIGWSKILSIQNSRLISADRAYLLGFLFVGGSIYLLSLDWGNTIQTVVGS